MKKERISELMDGELDAVQADLLLRRLGDAEAQATWSTYHLIGDALRGDKACDVAARVTARLAQEPTVLAPRPISSVAARGLGMSIAASVAAVTVVGYLALSTGGTDARYDTVQQVQLAPAKRAPSPIDDYLALHHGEVRNVAFEPAYRMEAPR
ncbi:MAG: anti-sigma 24 factor [Rhodocyclaceae bacterium]|nr:anti-sigma 24 factor [Rhodocyclaceae bacterium]